jgi:hypothetical protein
MAFSLKSAKLYEGNIHVSENSTAYRTCNVRRRRIFYAAGYAQRHQYGKKQTRGQKVAISFKISSTFCLGSLAL